MRHGIVTAAAKCVYINGGFGIFYGWLRLISPSGWEKGLFHVMMMMMRLICGVTRARCSREATAAPAVTDVQVHIIIRILWSCINYI